MRQLRQGRHAVQRLFLSLPFMLAMVAASPEAIGEAPVDCPLREQAYSVDGPLIDVLLKPQARVVVDAQAPGLLQRMPADFARPPTHAAIMSLRMVAQHARLPTGSLERMDTALRALPTTDADRIARCARYDVEQPDLKLSDARRRLLIFEKVNGHYHAEAIPAARAALQQVASRLGWAVAVTDQGGVMTPESLSRFDLVVWNNVSGDVLTLRQRAAFRHYIEHGGGFVGLHGAGGDALAFWDWYVDELIGTRFIGHPMDPQFQDARLRREEPHSAIGRDLPAHWTMNDEWYSFSASPRARGARVIATLDESSYAPVFARPGLSAQDLRMGADHPIAWMRCLGNGRSFYSAIGHRPESYAQLDYARLLERALIWAAGEGETACRDGKEIPDLSASMLSDDAVRARADALIQRMSPEEKAAQLTQYFYLQPHPAANTLSLEALATTGVGSLLFVTDPAEVNRLQRIAVEQSRLKIPVLFGFDVIHGLRTIFPVPIGLAASWDPALVERTQEVAARESRAVGVHWAFAPNLDIARDPRWGRIVETSGEDPYLASAMARAQVRGFQGRHIGSAGRVISGPKHFAGYGASLGGRDWDEVEVSDNELWNVHLPPFKAAIDEGAGAMMAAYMHLNGVPAAANKWLLSDILRDTLGFEGFVGSDSGSVNKLTVQNLTAGKQEAVARALSAGLDMEMVDPAQAPSMANLPAALAAGQVSQARVDEAVRRILSAKIRMGLFEQPYIDENAVEGVLNDPAHRRLAQLAAERSAVLLKNEGGLLPLDLRRIRSLAVIGPMADSERDTLGPWVFEQNQPHGVTVLQGLKAKLGSKVAVSYSEGVRMPKRVFPSPSAAADKVPDAPPLDETAEIRRAADLARQADAAVVVVGEATNMISEGGSRSSFDLPGRQQELLDAVVATGTPVIVVLFSARPIDLKETRAGAILDLWYPGSEGGSAVASLLFGDATPGGKLPFSWIRSPAHAPNHYAQLISHKPKPVQGRYWNETSAPTYPFGHGLSYTRFAYSNLRVGQAVYRVGEKVTVTVDLKNVGSRTGDEVAQLYIHQRRGTSARPARELKGFRRITLKPGETRAVAFSLSPDELHYWSAAAAAWVQDESAFDVWVGGSSQAELAGSFEVKGG